jgi:hypothetical protein
MAKWCNRRDDELQPASAGCPEQGQRIAAAAATQLGDHAHPTERRKKPQHVGQKETERSATARKQVETMSQPESRSIIRRP